MPPASIVAIVNAAAGSASARSASATEIGDLFRAAGREAEILTLRPGQDPAAVARDASTRAAIVVAGGGDGTVSAVAAGLIDSPAALGVLPLGTLNHFAKDLQIPLGLADAVAVIAGGHVERRDVGAANDRIFINNASVGVYPDILEEREALRRQGYRRWPAMAIATLNAVGRYRGMSVDIEVAGTIRSVRTPFVFVGNNEYAIEGLRIGSRARLDQGKLFVYLAPRARTRDLPLLLARAVIGRARQSGAFEIIVATEARIGCRRAGRSHVAIDGEMVVMRMPLSLRAAPAALRVVLPRP